MTKYERARSENNTHNKTEGLGSLSKSQEEGEGKWSRWLRYGLIAIGHNIKKYYLSLARKT